MVAEFRQRMGKCVQTATAEHGHQLFPATGPISSQLPTTAGCNEQFIPTTSAIPSQFTATAGSIAGQCLPATALLGEQRCA